MHIYEMYIYLRLLLLGLNSLSSLSLSSYEGCFRPFITFVALPCTDSSSASLSCNKEPRTGPSTANVASPVLSRVGKEAAGAWEAVFDLGMAKDVFRALHGKSPAQQHLIWKSGQVLHPVLPLQQKSGSCSRIVEMVFRWSLVRKAMLTKGNQVEKLFTEQMPFETNHQANRVGTSWPDATCYL